MDTIVPDALIRTGFDPRLVLLSAVLAVVAAYAALDLVGRVASASGRIKAFWLCGGAASMGVGIWSMHYVGMLALNAPIPIFYYTPTVLLSLLIAIGASGVALFVAAGPQSLWTEGLGSIVMGGGIAAMHYVGMAAMRCAATVIYDARILALSIAIAIAVSYAALKLACRLRADKKTSARKLFSAAVMGSAILLMHYTGMWAASFRRAAETIELHHTTSNSMVGVAAISMGSLFVLSLAIGSSFLDRFVEAQKGTLDSARERELLFQTMAEAIPEMIWTADSRGAVDYSNRKLIDYSGLTNVGLLGAGWKSIIHPDDLTLCLDKWQNALGSGQPYEMEFRIRAHDASYRWFLVRANPIRSTAGTIVKWFGSCTDIESQKQNQQVLEEEILKRTTELAQLNTQLQDEMIERDFARKQLDRQHEDMMEHLQERSQRATMLAKMGELLQSCIGKDEVIAAALGYAPKIFPSVRGAIALMNAQRSLAEVIGSWSYCQLDATDFEPTACWALRTGQPHLVVAGDSTATCAHASGVRHTYLCIPILAQGETMGIVHFQATDEAPQLEPSEVSLKNTFAGQLGLSIANIRLREALRTQSVRDALTGLYNRRYLDEILDRELRRAGRAGQSLGVLIVDLDHFKSFNDTYGHDAGDTVLREAGAALTRGVRAEDFVCRFGGEEFVIVLPTATLKNSSARAERLRSLLKNLSIMHQGRSLGTVTISVGVAGFPEHGASAKDLLAAADKALYEAKRGGRDRVVTASVQSEEDSVPASAQMATGL
ncbi:MAG TPA: diguanylate cyclase [Candidatus Binatia bacterium]|nr:diguanylate cyclase [Candidatus Binatia bacterium]